MKYLLTFFMVAAALATVCTLILFISAFIAWLGGDFNVILPGLGLVISGTFILVVLLIIGIIMFLLTVLLARMIFKPLR